MAYGNRIIKKLILAIICFLICSCAHFGDRGFMHCGNRGAPMRWANNPTVYFWDTAPIDHVIAITNAVADLNNRCGCEVVEISYNGNIAITGPLPIESGAKLGLASLRCDRVSGDIYGARISIAREVKGWTLRRVATHELGHALGLDHDNAAGSVMSQYSTSTNFTETDIDRIRGRYCAK